MPLPDNVTVVRVRGYLFNADGTPSTREVRFLPTVEYLTDVSGNAHINLHSVKVRPDDTGYWYADVIATNDPDLTAFAWQVQVGSSADVSIAVPYDTPAVPVGGGVTMPALWLAGAATIPVPTLGPAYYTALQVDALLDDLGGGAVSSVNARTGAVTGLAEQSALDAGLAAKASTAALTSHTGNTSNPHSVTAAQLGLGNVTDTSDANKPVSTAQQAAIDAVVTGLATVATSGSAADLTGTLDDARIPSAIARDVEVAAAVADAGVYPLSGLGFHSASCDPESLNVASTFNAAWVLRVWVPAGKSISQVFLLVNAAASSAAGGLNGAALYSDDGQTKLGETVNGDSWFAATGLRSLAMTSTIAAQSSGRFIRVVINTEGLATVPSVTYFNNWPGGTIDAGALRRRTAFISTSFTGAWPATINPDTLGAPSAYLPFVALS